MTTLTFSKSAGTLSVDGGATYPAGNNVDSHSLGHWPLGTFPFAWYDKDAADGPEGSFGSYGVLVFAVPGRTGMGVHSGRATTPDLLGRVGVEHCTLGCVRSKDGALSDLVALHAEEPITQIAVVR